MLIYVYQINVNKQVDSIYIYIYERSPTRKVELEIVDQEKRLVEFAGCITLAGSQRWGVGCCLA